MDGRIYSSFAAGLPSAAAIDALSVAGPEAKALQKASKDDKRETDDRIMGVKLTSKDARGLFEWSLEITLSGLAEDVKSNGLCFIKPF